MQESYRKTELKVGLFILIMTAIGLIALVYVGVEKNLFAEKIRFYVTSSTGENVERGIPVRLFGFRIGQVTDVSLKRVGSIVIEISVLKKYRQWFTSDAKIILDQEGLIGNSYLKLIPGAEDAPPLSAGASLPLDKVGGTKELIAEARPVIEDMKAIVVNIRNITDQFLETNGSMQTILTNLETTTTRINESRGLVHYLTQDPRPVDTFDSILSRTDQALLQADQLLQTANVRIEDLEPLQDELIAILKEGRMLVKEFQGIRNDLAPILDNVERISSEVKNATAGLRTLRNKSEHTLRLSNELLERLEDRWPFEEDTEPLQKRGHPIP